MNDITTNVSRNSSIPIRACPFCGSQARLVVHDQVRRAVQCSNCSASVPTTSGTEFEALFRWNSRSSGAAAAGGRATKGLTSAKKRRSSRANLALARRSKQMKAIRAKTDAVIVQLRPFRDAEGQVLQELAAETSARLAALLPKIEADPVLKGMVGVLKRPHEAANCQPTSRTQQRISPSWCRP
jgi:hypothetical protein